MTWRNRLKLFVGLVAVVAVVGTLTLVFSTRKGETTSSSASIEAIAFPVGTDYPGSVTAQYVEEGDQVAVGDPIATIQSNTLYEQLADGATIASNAAYDVAADGTLTIKSTVEGIVDEVLVHQGGYAGAGTPVAEISATTPLHVSAEFVLDPKDFSRLEKGAKVDLELPNMESIEGVVDSYEVETVDGEAQAVVKITSDQLVYGENGGLIAPGTPVTAEMKLRNDDALAHVIASVKDFARDLKDAVTE
jgi:multidrug resistance efflux pump